MIKKILLTVLGLVVGLLALQMIASESGEVVVLSSMGESGPEETRLWVVEYEGYQYLRAGAPESGWFSRIRNNGRVGLDRDGVRAAYDAIPQVEVRDQVNDLMRQKYGWADQFIALLFGRDDATPIRLELYREAYELPEAATSE